MFFRPHKARASRCFRTHPPHAEMDRLIVLMGLESADEKACLRRFHVKTLYHSMTNLDARCTDFTCFRKIIWVSAENDKEWYEELSLCYWVLDHIRRVKDECLLNAETPLTSLEHIYSSLSLMRHDEQKIVTHFEFLRWFYYYARDSLQSPLLFETIKAEKKFLLDTFATRQARKVLRRIVKGGGEVASVMDDVCSSLPPVAQVYMETSSAFFSPVLRSIEEDIDRALSEKTATLAHCDDEAFRGGFAYLRDDVLFHSWFQLGMDNIVFMEHLHGLLLRKKRVIELQLANMCICHCMRKARGQSAEHFLAGASFQMSEWRDMYLLVTDFLRARTLWRFKVNAIGAANKKV